MTHAHNHGPRDRDGDPVGSLAEEAAKLFKALRGESPDWAAGVRDVGDVAGSLWQDAHRHLGSDGNCRYCPVCQLIGLVRQPEVRGHLVAAGRSLAAALASALATPVPDEARPNPPKRVNHSDDGAA